MSWLDHLLGRPETESVFFFTLHKCASTLFSEFALKRFIGLRHSNPAQQIYRGRRMTTGFERFGRVFGPIRLSVMSESPEARLFVNVVATEEFIRDRKALFLIRDPRDILVSAYHSFGFTHGYSRNPDLRRLQEERRARIQSMSIDEYAISAAPDMLSAFGAVSRLQDACSRSAVLTYEDMIGDWDRFSAALSGIVAMRAADLEELRRRTRPRSSIDPSSHRRSGATGQFRAALRPETAMKIGETLAPVLVRFGYPV